MMEKFTKEQLEEDIIFLAKRQTKTSKITFGDRERDTGSSSNSIVSIAYGIIPLSEQEFPGDLSDMAACENMWNKLPYHRKTGDALKAIELASQSKYVGKILKKNYH
jgi:hypothetical protein